MAGSYEIIDPTIRPFQPFNALDDAKTLRAAMKGLGTNEEKIIKILTKRTSKQRAEIAITFNREFNRVLQEDLRSELGGKFETVILALMDDPAEYLAKELHSAMDKIGTNEDMLTEILCTRGDDEIRKISDAYTKIYEKSLTSELSSEVSGDYKRLLTLLLTTSRSTDNFDATQIATKLYSAGEGRLGTDEEAFVFALAHHSFPQLKLVFKEYEKLAGKTFEQAVRAEMSGDLKEAILTIARRVESLPRYFAELLHEAMTGLDTSDRTLIRLIVTRAEIDLGAVKKEYQALYHKTVESDVKGETGGDYEAVLLSILEGNYIVRP
ncbi:annexin B10 isoform X2 [Folsomia candida]|uniref:annexin B10 isoform X2 n=1 Tax=Folsomia candida TaxID=158441 RepID=UPI000B8F3D28|nr:annexin B10 isoform X2 [Folsomia candida]XP_035705300.1 annexin B10 isoform X2 [Folsomia candida]